MKPELKSKIITYGLCGCAGLSVLNNIITFIVARTFLMKPSFMIKSLTSFTDNDFGSYVFMLCIW